ncbi:MAG: sugar ABC transporter substrate-binding protein [Streptomyces sp.]|nr:sugar ABC transporter substrate-binding protein [Streptomyces sp.]NUP63290.1 sugar ABC transporter substrate-binding protein [Nonomuraea sp.]NUS17204.1 sugar ABC transporter substrate-binding protein [Streptomyces sp.]NUS75637.1 sugar ABC transporter substrate-binding protein [Streptomyces sp.]
MSRSARSHRAFVASVLGSCGCLVLSGCGLLAEDAAPAVVGPVTLGFVNGGSTRFHQCLEAAVEDTALNNSARIHTAESRQDAATELANIQDMIARHVDALIVQTVDVDALQKDIAKAKKAGVPIFLTSVVTDDTTDILGAVVVDLKQVGALDAGWIEKDAAGQKVNVGVVAGAPGAASDLLVGGFKDALPANATVVANQPGMFSPAKARKVAAGMIEAHPDLDYAFVASEEMAFAVREAFDAAGAKAVKIVTVNGTDEGLAALKDGRFAATVANSAADTGELAVTNALALLRGEGDVDKVATTRVRLVTKGTADTAPLYCDPDPDAD